MRWRGLGFLLFIVAFAYLQAWPDSELAVVAAGVAQSEDGPFVSADYRFLPGDTCYFVFSIAGFGAIKNTEEESRKISLHYQVTPENAKNIALAPPISGDITEELHPEDKNWMPKREAAFLIPSFVVTGTYHIHAVVEDRVAHKSAERDIPFQIGGLDLRPVTSLAVEDFRFFREESSQQPLELPAYAPGDAIFARFVITGFKYAPENEYRISYGLTVLRPDGGTFLNQPKAAEIQDKGFYPASFVPGAVKITTSRDTSRGMYALVLTVRDLISNQTCQLKQTFTIE